MFSEPEVEKDLSVFCAHQPICNMKLIVLMTVVMVGQALSPSSHLSPADLARLKAVFVQVTIHRSYLKAVVH